MGWQIYPDGLRNFLTRRKTDHVGNPPLYMTENDMANVDLLQKDTVPDDIRTEDLFAHIAATKQAIAQGANVKSFF